MAAQVPSSTDDSQQRAGSQTAGRGWFHSLCLRIGWRRFCGMAVFLAAVTGLFLANYYWPFRYRQVEPLLQKVFASQIKIVHYRRTYFPHPGFVADNLTLRRNSAPDLPPVGSARHVVVQGRWIDLLMLHRNVHLVFVEGLHIVIPPVGSRANKEDFPPGSSADFAGPDTLVQQLNIHDAILDIMRVDGTRYRFPIHQLILRNLLKGRAVPYFVDIGIPQPVGRIQATGSFGPLAAGQLPRTPVSGTCSFAPINLGSIPHLGGTFSGTGHLRGPLAGMQADAQGDIPDFAVGSGRPTHVTARAQGIVNGLNGDMILKSIDARDGNTTLVANGGILGRPKAVNLELSIIQGRAQDVLRPFVPGEPPIVGAVKLHGHAYLAPSQKKATFFERLRMEGAFDVPAERLTSTAAEQKLSAFSHRAQGRKSSTSREDTLAKNEGPSGAPEVLSGIGGGVRIRDGVAYFERLRFRTPGAWVDLHGTFSLRNHSVHLLGDLHMDSDISHATTGFKSLLLKPFAPFFKKDNAGAVIPIAITGSSKQYKVSSNLLHHK